MHHVIATVTGDQVSVRILDQPSLTTVSLDHHNTVVRGDDFVYLDVGRWGGNARNFGVIYGGQTESYVAVCEYTGQPGGARRLPGQAGDTRTIRVVRNFLNTCLSRIVYGGRFAGTHGQSVNTDGKLYLLLGDLHLPLVNHLCSIWQNRQSGVPEIPCRVDKRYMEALAPTSLLDFFNLRGLANLGLLSPSAGVDRLRIDAIGQWYQQYLSNDIFTDASSNAAAQDLHHFVELAQGWEPASPRDGQEHDSTSIHFVQLGDMYELWVGLKCLFRATPESRRVVQLQDPPCRRQGGSTDQCATHSSGSCTRTPPRSDAIVGEWVDMVNENTTITIIQGNPPVSLAQYLHNATTFSHKDWLIGNHDNYLYLQQLSRSCRVPQRSEYLHENQILMEHGHNGDVYNRFGATSGHDITQGGAFVWNLRPFTALGMDEIRRGFLKYAVKKYVGTQFDFKAFVMAHTHLPFLGVVTIGQMS